MSWREFRALLSGISPHGAVASHYTEALKEQEASRPKTQAEQHAAANRFWASAASL